MSSPTNPSSLERYSRQTLFAGLGEDGQRRLMKSHALLVGCGALGTVLAETLVRAGVGSLRIVDRDFVEISNLQRQVLFDEDDVADRVPKAVAAANKLRRINSHVEIDAVVTDAGPSNIRQLAEGAEVILDGTDNFEIRFLLNDLSLETGVPWIYGGVIGSHGQTMTIFPNKTACLRCLIETAPAPGTTDTCDTAGVIGPAVNVVASLEATAAMKILSGRRDLVEPVLTVIDVWDGTFRQMSVRDLRDQGDCPACKRGERPWLRGEQGSQSTVLCGRNAVQVAPPEGMSVDFDDLAKKLKGVGEVSVNRYLLRLELSDPDYELTIFKDGRAIIKGTDKAATARSIYARYVGT